MTFDFVKYLNSLNLIFFSSLILTVLIALALIPRQFAFLIAGAYLIFVIFAPLEKSALLFVRSIPFFIALPITSTFDNFNTWRLVVLAIFIKWLFFQKFNLNSRIYINTANIRKLWKNYKVEILSIMLFISAFLSLFAAQDLVAGAKRIIYFANLIMIFVVISNLISKNKKILLALAKNILFGGSLVLFFGYLQLISTYFVPINVWHHWWGEQISLGFYGQNWSNIVMQGNTWFSYTAGSLKLRMFSVFPDSHSFPIYLLLIIPFLLSAFYGEAAKSIFASKTQIQDACLLNLGFKKKWQLIKTKLKENPKIGDYLIFTILLAFALILSGTRGIWVSVVFPIIWGFFFIFRYKRLRRWMYPILKIILIFLILFPAASLLWFFPQFRLEKTASTENGLALVKRFKSSFDTEETSNLGRIFIWQETAKSLMTNPFLGVGIGNYPVVLKQDVSLAKAGSSAHNLYLNVAAEMGIAAMMLFLWLLFEILRNAWKIFRNFDEKYIKIFGLASIAFLLWVFGYNLTDAALFDERAFLMFMTLSGAISGLFRYHISFSVQR